MTIKDWIKLIFNAAVATGLNYNVQKWNSMHQKAVLCHRYAASSMGLWRVTVPEK